MRTRLTWLVAGLALATAGLLAVRWLGEAAPGSTPPPVSEQHSADAARRHGKDPPPTAEATASQLRVIREILLEEIEARERLEAEVETLRAELDAPASRGIAGEPRSEDEREDERPWFDEAALLTAGLDPQRAAEMRARFEALEMDRLYLQDRATREGWHGTSRFVRERRALDERSRGLRAELGDAQYDWYLYATGQPNRVEVRDVLEQSPAGRAGVARGDVIERYDDARVFDVAELLEATRGGRAAESVALDVVRDGERVRIRLPRGPLGVRLRRHRREPEELP